MRINQYIAKSGLCSRRKAEEYIKEKRVKVNGHVVENLGMQILGTDNVMVDEKKIRPVQQKLVYLFSKPYGVTSTMRDIHADKTLLDFFGNFSHRLFPIGRLDKDSTGLLLMTNDGDLTFELTHPSKEHYKTYLLKVFGEISLEQIKLLEKGILLEDGLTSSAKVRFYHIKNNSTEIEISIREGKNRQLRRMFDRLQCPVQSLRRIGIGKLFDFHLQDGCWRKLTEKEIKLLKE